MEMAHNRDEVGDNEHETSQNCANYPHPVLVVVNNNEVASSRHESLAKRRWKSDFELLLSSSSGATNQKINKRMGIRVSRWQSADNVTVDENFVYRPLSKVNVLVNRDEVIDNANGEDDYELLESSSACDEDDELEVEDEEGGVNDDDDLNGNNNDRGDKSNDIHLSEFLVTQKTTMNSDDGQHDFTENSRCCTLEKKSTNTPLLNHNELATTTITTSSNANCQSSSVIRKFSTLPRAKSRENITRNENAVRKSYKLSSRHSDKIDVQEMMELEKSIQRQESDKNFPSKCTTTTRSRFSEPPHGLNRLSVVDQLKKHSSERSGNNNATTNVPTSSSSVESTSGTDSGSGGIKRSRSSNLSWLRKSMKKLKSLQLPIPSAHPPPSPLQQQQQQHIQPQIESTLSNSLISPPTTTTEINPIEKENIRRENYLESASVGVGDMTPHVVNGSMEIFVATSGASENNVDVFNVVLQQQQQQQDINENRPRQYGRRSNPIRVSSLVISDPVNHTAAAARIIAHHQEQRRPSSAPVTAVITTAAAATTTTTITRSTTSSANLPRNSHRPRQSLPSSEPSSMASSRNSSPVSLVSSTGSSSVPDAEIRPRFNSQHLTSDDDEREQSENATKTSWPHLLSRSICCVFCTLGLFNISRFAIFSVHFGANFLVQFLLLSFIFGIPFLWLQMVLGHKIKGGIVTMYKITPICKGIGISLMISHCIITLYSSVSIAWVLIYLRDSIISSDGHYLWEERFDSYRGYQNISQLKLSENIADYFNGVVLQRLSGLQIAHDGKMRFQLAFNVSIVWILIFIILCKGIRSLGKIAIGLCLFSFLCLVAVCIKFLMLLNFETVQDIFPATDWQDFFANSNSWSVAAQEVFLTWGLFGVSIYSIYCKADKNQRLNHYVLRREALLIVFLTLFGLFLGGVLGSTCIIILKLNGFNYSPASFENPKNDIFLWPMHYASLPSFHHSIPSNWITRYSNVIGESFERPIFVNQQGVQVYKESGYKPIRLLTEILPATLAISSRIEPIWGTLIFLSLFLFGLGQLAVMWKPISGAIGNSTSAILLSCVTGLFLGVPLTTDNGIVILHFFDYIFGGSWFLPVLWSCYLLSIFMVRGRPFTSDILVKELKLTETLSAFVAFSWNVLMPVGLLLLSVMEYKKSHSTELFHQRNILSLSHLSNWSLWVKQVGGFLQVSLLILLPCVALIQIYIYLTRGPRDILERIERLFRPPMDNGDSSSTSHMPIRRLCQTNFNQAQPIAIPNNETNSISLTNDAPPKYSPPPSYGRAMGLRVAAKVIRNSIRRSVRRFRRAELPQVETQNIPTISSTVSTNEARTTQSPPAFSNINEFIRASFSRRNATSSTEQLVLSEMSIASNEPMRDNNQV